MKKLFYLVCVVLVGCALTACGGDDEDFSPSSSKVKNNGYPYVDLGLSAYWATFNVGAYSPTAMGDKYAFGETSTKSEYTSSNYIGGYSDVATILWGEDWRMPTSSELEELVENCNWQVCKENGKQVVKVTGPNGNSIFLPYYSYIDNEGYAGWYWSSTSYSSNKGYCLHFQGNEVSSGTNSKYIGMLVRPVITNPNYVDSNIGNNSGGGDNPSGGGSSSYEKPDIGFYDFTATKTSLKVEYKIYNKDEAQVSSAKIYYGTSSNPSSSKSASVSGTLITANISGLKAGTTYYVKCVATGKGGTTTTSVTKCTTNY